MSTGSNPTPAGTAPRSASPSQAVLKPGSHHWHAHAQDQIWVRLQFIPQSKLEVDIWWNQQGRHPDVQLQFGLYNDFVELGCLNGNGFDRPHLQGKGFGTFAVNIAVQALQACYPPHFKVQGLLSNTAEAELAPERRRELEGNRRAFWRRFGLGVLTRDDPPLDFLAGQVGHLQVVRDGLLAGQFPRCVSLAEFGPQPAPCGSASPCPPSDGAGK